VRGHADAETLAAFREELLSRRKAARVSVHLAACPRCAALDAQLAGVTALLTRTAAPPMPDALTARIEAALAAEAAARPATAGAAAPAAAAPAAATPGGAGHHGTRGTGGHRAGRPARGRSRLALRVAAVTAAVAVIAGGGYGVSRLLSASPENATGASASGAGAPAIKSAGALPGMSTGGMRSPVSGTSGGASNSTVLARVVTSGTNYQPARLAAQAATVLAESGLDAPGSASPAPSVPVPQNRPASLFPDLQACVAHVAAGQHPLLVDAAQYQGHPALIVMLPAVSGGRPRALVIAPGCSAATAHVLATATLPRSG
jgi:hypothetical protein